MHNASVKTIEYIKFISIIFIKLRELRELHESNKILFITHPFTIAMKTIFYDFTFYVVVKFTKNPRRRLRETNFFLTFFLTFF